MVRLPRTVLMLFVLFVSTTSLLFAQLPTATSADARAAGFESRQSMLEASLVAEIPFRNVGPTVMSGRVVDIDANPDDGTHFYVAYASGGLWYTGNNGTSFSPLFDDQAVMTLGDIAVDWNRDGVIWVGTGENNSSRSSYAGAGIYLSEDGGSSWTYKGLKETQRTGRIILHPSDPNTLWVAAAGALYSRNEHRGVYKSTDGGETWQKTLYVDDVTGAIDLIIDPDDANTLYAAMWHRERMAWNFVESGEGSGIYKSTDGGETWALLTTPESGFPTGEGVGRIGLALFPGENQVLYALLDNYDRRPPEEEEDAGEEVLTRDALRSMDASTFLALDDETIQAYLDDNNFLPKHTVAYIREQVASGAILPEALVSYVEDANSLLFNTPVIGAEVYRSEDGGMSWQRTHEGYIDFLYNSYGYYFGEIRVSPFDANRIFVLGVPLLASDDGGATFYSADGPSVHADHQAMWMSDKREGHIINGNDGGLNISYDGGETWAKANTPAVGQFYAIQVDNAKPYNVYGGLQDNGVWKGPSTYQQSVRWHASGRYPYESVLGGDGMQVEVDTRTNDIIYTGFQFGNYFRIGPNGSRQRIRPWHELGERPLRYNWQTPVHLSRHNQDILYLGSNKLHRSMNQGTDWTTLSDDLTQGGKKGDVPYGTLATIDESPLQFGLLYVGSDDGLIHRSQDGGVTWDRLSDNLPANMWISRVEASSHDVNRVYATLNGYRYDHFKPYVYASDDQGDTWTSIAANLPDEPVNVVLEDPVNENVLYVGTDNGLYVSLDRGASYMPFAGSLPNVAVHDLKFQERENDLVVGTHGRSIYIGGMDQVQALTPAMLESPLHVFPIASVRHSERWGTAFANWMEPTVPSVDLYLYSAEAGDAVMEISDEDGRVLHRNESMALRKGVNIHAYELEVDASAARKHRKAYEDALMPGDNGVIYLPAGTYTVKVSRRNHEVSGKLVVDAE